MQFFESYYKSAKKLPDEERLAFYDKLLAYMFDDDDSEIEGAAGAVFEAIKPVVQKSKRRSNAGAEGGKVSKTQANGKQIGSKTEAKRKQTVSKPEANGNGIGEGVGEGVKDNPPLPPQREGKETATSLIEAKQYEPELETAVKEWVQYKAEKRQGYKPTGLKSLLTEVANNAAKYGNPVVIDVIRKSIAANYTGIVWDWCRARQPTPVKKWASDEPPDYDPYAGVDKDALADFIRVTEGNEVDQDVLDAFYHAKEGG